MKSRPYGSWTRQDRGGSRGADGRGPARGRRADREGYRGRRSSRRAAPGRSRGPRYGRLLLALAGAVLIVASVGLVFVDVQRADEAVSAGPRDRDMELTIPAMKRVKDVPVYGGPVGEEAALHDGTFHVGGTGFPWQREANVYIAGHRIGYPRTDSFFVFWDLQKLKNGRRVVLADAENTRYVYRVFDRFVVGPGEVSVKKPIAGKNIVSLQTCTLPDYSRRLIVQAELVRTIDAPAQRADAGVAG